MRRKRHKKTALDRFGLEILKVQGVVKQEIKQEETQPSRTSSLSPQVEREKSCSLSPLKRKRRAQVLSSSSESVTTVPCVAPPPSESVTTVPCVTPPPPLPWGQGVTPNLLPPLSRRKTTGVTPNPLPPLSRKRNVRSPSHRPPSNAEPLRTLRKFGGWKYTRSAVCVDPRS